MRNSYHTQQRCALLAFLSAHADEQFTVEQLLAAMGDEAPGRSTVYRALDRLVEEGTVRRFAPGERRQRGLSGHGSGPLRRAPAPQVRGLRAADPSDEGVSDALQSDLLRAAGFTVDGRSTTIYGTCAACGRKRDGHA